MSCSHEHGECCHGNGGGSGGNGHGGPLGADGANVCMQYSLFKHIDVSKTYCLNARGRVTPFQVIRPWHDRLQPNKFMESDVDEQLLIHVHFTGLVKLRSIALRTMPDDTAPTKLYVFANVDCSFDFDSAEQNKEYATQTFDLVCGPDTPADAVIYNVNRMSFRSVRSLTFYFAENAGAPRSQIHWLGLSGEFTEVNRRPVVTVYEAQPNPAEQVDRIPGIAYDLDTIPRFGSGF